jgi:hypothetical protein
VQVAGALGHDIHDDDADTAAQIAGTLHRKQTAIGGAILVGRADELDRGHQARTFFLAQHLDFKDVWVTKIERSSCRWLWGSPKSNRS